MLSDKEVAFLREELSTAQNPLFFYDDDGDGLCAFLLLYRMKHEGCGSILKTSSKLDASFMRKVDEYHPDKIFILDIPMVEQEFVDKAKRPIFWIDHHEPQQIQNVHYFNPKIKEPDSYIPTSRMAYQVSNNPEDLWLATVGCLFDWHMPNFIGEFIEKYPHLLSEKTDLKTAVYEQPIGKLVRMFSFLLKGKHSDVMNSIKILTRIKSPDEILQQQTSQGKFLFKHFSEVNSRYLPLIKSAKKKVGKGKVIVFTYSELHWSFTIDLANELTAHNPEKVIIIARKKSEEMKCSLRAQFPIDKALAKALIGVEGYGGGHPHACGAAIKEKDWERFLKNFKEEIEKEKESQREK
ncbi:DHH family phosphoesterase [Candidatus Woesearchaeota archaeon]|nr:DHH family phosphoesterase [Candidatus Woesearchaeota archaeon]